MVPLAAARRLALLTLVTLLAGLLAAAVPVRGAGAAPGVQGRVWLVDAVDDEQGSRWVSQDTGTSTITIQVGDTVEWTFDRAGLEHDLTSLDTGTPWPEPIQRYFFPGEAGMLQTFTQPGTYFYVCTLHNTEMTGVVIVEDPDGNRAPTGTATVAPQSGPAPLDVHFTAAGFTDPDGDQLTYAWDFGTGRAMDRSTQAHAMFRYETPGTYVAWLTVSDGHGGEFVRQFPIQVAAGSGDGGDGGSGGDQDTLPEVAAVATPASGTAPLEVALSAETTARGTFVAYADGLASYPDLTGTARITRARGRTEVAIDVTGLAPGKAHLVHVHDNPCAVNNAGAHFRFDEAQPFGEANELWLPFTSDASGRSGAVTVRQPLRAGAKAVSIVIHDPDNAAKRIGCVDLAPDTADLRYDWSFGDGATGAGADPTHTYTAPGTYWATVIVSRSGHSHHGAATPVSASVKVVVAARDTAGPRVRLVGPTGTTRKKRPTLRATVTDASGVRKARITITVDGRKATRVRYVARIGRLTALPAKKLKPGRHTVRVVAVDNAGNRTAKTWRFRVRR